MPSYSMIPSVPPIAPEEVELSDVRAIEICVRWGNSVLHVAHVNPGRDFYIGESQDEPCGCFVPKELLGVDRMPLVVASPMGPRLVLPAQASGRVCFSRDRECSVEEARASAELLDGASSLSTIALQPGMRACFSLNGIVYDVALVAAGRPLRRTAYARDWAAMPYFGLSLAVHAGVLGALAFLTPSLGLASDDDLDRERFYRMQEYLSSAAEREQERRPQEESSSERSSAETGDQSAGAEGALGNPTAAPARKRYAVQGPRDNVDPHLAREQAVAEAMAFGMVGLLASASGSDAPTAPWGRDLALGTDEVSARGVLWADEIGDAFGAGGLGLAGPGQGSGGKGVGIGLTDIGLGPGMGGEQTSGFAQSAGRLQGTHAPRGVRLRIGETIASGRLPAEVIQRVVRQNFGRFRHCYSLGLTRNPNLEGRVAARFVIARDGSVTSVSNGGSDLPDSAVTSCVLSAFYGLSFPEPEHGIVTVVYPILLSPG